MKGKRGPRKSGVDDTPKVLGSSLPNGSDVTNHTTGARYRLRVGPVTSYLSFP